MKSKRKVWQQIRNLRLGEPVEVLWFDASKGEARLDKQAESSIQFDVPVRSIGYFVGVAGKKSKHLILARDHFELNKDLEVHDVDFNSIPVAMIHSVGVPQGLDRKVAELLHKALLKIKVRKQRGRKILRLTEMN
jgi:hypothetical protein